MISTVRIGNCASHVDDLLEDIKLRNGNFTKSGLDDHLIQLLIRRCNTSTHKQVPSLDDLIPCAGKPHLLRHPALLTTPRDYEAHHIRSDENPSHDDGKSTNRTLSDYEKVDHRQAHSPHNRITNQDGSIVVHRIEVPINVQARACERQ